MSITIIAAKDLNNLIGNNGTLPWQPFKKDFQWFYNNTTGKTVVMGRKNFEDIIKFTKGNPLKNRTNIVLTKNKNIKKEGFIFINNINEIIKKSETEEIIIIGGAEIYKQFMPHTNKLIITTINNHYNGDTYFPEIPEKEFITTKLITDIENNILLQFNIFEKIKN